MVGNDVVDLSDPETAQGARHRRFDRRVFASGELESLSIERAGADPRWIVWSAKEAAYKAARREFPHIVFSPKRFFVSLDRSLCGSVAVGTRRWPVRIRIVGNCVHAVVSTQDPSSDTLSGTARLADAELGDPSLSARRFAIDSIAARLGIPPSDLRIERINRIPALVIARESEPIPLSLSHHGRYVGFACCDLPAPSSPLKGASIDWESNARAARPASYDGTVPNLVRPLDARRSILC